MRETLLIRDGWRDSDLYAIVETDSQKHAGPTVRQTDFNLPS